MARLPSAQDEFRRKGRMGHKLAGVSHESGISTEDYEYMEGMLCPSCGLRLPGSGVCSHCGHGRYNAARMEGYVYCSGSGCYNTSSKQAALRNGWTKNGADEALCPECMNEHFGR